MPCPECNRLRPKHRKNDPCYICKDVPGVRCKHCSPVFKGEPDRREGIW